MIRCCRNSKISLLVAALAMVIETSCSQAPAPNTTGEHKDVVTKIHTVGGTVTGLAAEVGATVSNGAVLCEITGAAADEA
jgi:hypothetical protein